MLLDAGRRDRYITIQTLTSSKGTSMRPVESWSALTTTWAEKVDSTGNERFAGNSQLTAAMTTTWTIPYRADMDPERIDVAHVRRLVYNGRIYDILSGRMTGDFDDIELQTLAKQG